MTALVITAKDLLLLARDRRTAAMLLVLPLVFIGIIGLTTGKFPGLGGATPAVTVVVADKIDYEAIGAEGFDDPPDAALPADVLPSPAYPAAEAETERVKARNTVVQVMKGFNDSSSLPGRHAGALGGDRRPRPRPTPAVGPRRRGP